MLEHAQNVRTSGEIKQQKLNCKLYDLQSKAGPRGRGAAPERCCALHPPGGARLLEPKAPRGLKFFFTGPETSPGVNADNDPLPPEERLVQSQFSRHFIKPSVVLSKGDPLKVTQSSGGQGERRQSKGAALAGARRETRPGGPSWRSGSGSGRA